jgi:hypothetical protein
VGPTPALDAAPGSDPGATTQGVEGFVEVSFATIRWNGR